MESKLTDDERFMFDVFVEYKDILNEQITEVKKAYKLEYSNIDEIALDVLSTDEHIAKYATQVANKVINIIFRV